VGDERVAGAVVFVHGIGQQSPGSTLARFGQPLADYCMANHGPGSSLERRSHEWALTLEDGRERSRWLITEVHWDDVVAPPTYRRLLRWMVVAVPWILHSDALLWSQRRPRKRLRRWWWMWALWVYVYLWTFARSMLLLVGGLVVQLVLALVGIVGLLPALRRPARWLQSLLIGSVGDSYAYIFDDATWRRIEQRLEDTLRLVSAHADKVVVVTHSQGTAVMHRAVWAGRTPQAVTTWVSVGSGLQKLLALHLTRSRTLVTWAIFRLVAVGLVLVSIPFWGMEHDATTGDDAPADLTAASVLLALLALLAPLVSVRRLRSRVHDAIRFPLSRHGFHLLDMYSFHDPVPGGPIAGTTGDDDERPVASVEVHNEGSFLRDHSAYLDNVEDVVSRIHDLMVPTTSSTSELASEHRERRARRVRLRRPLWALAAGLTCAFSAPAVWLAPGTALDVSAVAVSGVLTFRALDRTWRSWNKQASVLSMTHPLEGTPRGALAIPLTLLALAALLAITSVALATPPADTALTFVVGSGALLLFCVCPLAAVLLLSIDHRARRARRRASNDAKQ